MEKEGAEVEVSFHAQEEISKSEPDCQLDLVISGQARIKSCMMKKARLRAKLLGWKLSAHPAYMS